MVLSTFTFPEIKVERPHGMRLWPSSESHQICRLVDNLLDLQPTDATRKHGFQKFAANDSPRGLSSEFR